MSFCPTFKKWLVSEPICDLSVFYMPNGRREFLVVLLAAVSVGAFFRYRENSTNAGNEWQKQEVHEELVVWSSEKSGGQTWGNLGKKGQISYPPDSGLNRKGKALTIRMMGEGFRGCGLNWKGWFPADACDDVSKYTALVFHIRQITKIENLDLTVCLVDNVPRAKGETVSNAVSIISDGGVERIDGKWRRVTLPLARFTQNRSLRLDRLWGIDFMHVGNGEVAFQIDRISFTNDKTAAAVFPHRPTYKATAKVDLFAKSHPVSDSIYGVCSLPPDKLRQYAIPITRWGGNPSSRYNWKINADNGANDWYFKNRGTPLNDLSENGYLRHIRTAQSLDATTYQTIPMLGWVAKDHSSYSYSLKKYGRQKGIEPGHDDIGNGIGVDGKPIRWSDPSETSIAIGPAFVAEAVSYVAENAGYANGGSEARAGVKYWVLDNEPMLWHETHRDVRPEPLGYDELWERTVSYAEVIKKADPSAKVAGFCSWGWTDLFYSAKDEGGDRYSSLPDFRSHGNMPLAEWFICKCAEYKKKNGTALIDVFDFHWYPQAQFQGKTPYMGKGMDLTLNELRMRSTRDLWDPDYVQESWIRNSGDRKPTQVIRRVRQWIEKHNPSMEICLGEYNFGGSDNITGGLAQADVFGILAREKVDLAFIWSTPEGTQNLGWQLFRNFDGAGGRFGRCYVPVSCTHPDLSIYAARRDDGATTIVIINKNLGAPCELKLEACGLTGNLRMWRFDQKSEGVEEMPVDACLIDGSVTLKLPAASASMLIAR